MQAVLDGTVLADADEAEVVSTEGNWYFPPEAVTLKALSETPLHHSVSTSTCRPQTAGTRMRRGGTRSRRPLRSTAWERISADTWALTPR
ncbi:DUF427 domain-containing protein [Streptomyces sp. SID1121]|uniref:DUF427 domain-containing protein n=1 Tax=Streptomyces sp. SID1121 TaxID=3425888 RepID=UPI00405750E0